MHHFSTISLARLAASVAGAAMLVSIAPAHAAGTLAGSNITNVAAAEYDDGSGPKTIDSNQVVMRVDELLNVTVVANDSGPVVVAPGSSNRVLSFTFTNTGNGPEGFALSAVGTLGGDQFDPTSVRIVIDDGDGVYEEGIDTIYVPGSGDPMLAPDTSQTVFIVSNIPGGLADGNLGNAQLVVAAKTGTGPAGTNFAGAGENGSDAVTGLTTARGEAQGTYQITASTVALTKSAVVVDPFGGSKAVPGATITYTLVASVTGSGSVSGLVVTDPIPTGSTYVPGSMKLGTTTLTDTATDGDNANFNGSRIAVTLGTVPAGETRSISFAVKIN